MYITVTVITLAVLIILFCMECAGKLNKLGAARGNIYLLILLLFTGELSYNVYNLEYNFDPLETNGVWDFIKRCIDWSQVLEIIFRLIVITVGTVLAIIACAMVLRKELKKSAVKDSLCKSTNLVISFTLSELITGVVIFIAASTILALGLAISFIDISAFFIIAFFAIILTFGLAIPFILLFLPVLILDMGLNIIFVCLPHIAMLTIWGTCFTIIHIMTIIFSIFILIKCKKENIISRKNAIILGILHAIPFFNIITSFIVKSKIKKFTA